MCSILRFIPGNVPCQRPCVLIHHGAAVVDPKSPYACGMGGSGSVWEAHGHRKEHAMWLVCTVAKMSFFFFTFMTHCLELSISLGTEPASLLVYVSFSGDKTTSLCL